VKESALDGMLGPISLPPHLPKGDVVANSSRILFVGGCHIHGYPVGKEHAFTHVALKSLSQHEEVSSNGSPHFNLHSRRQILAVCEELKPDVIVLQLGHYEAPAILGKCLGARRSKKNSTAEISGAGHTPNSEERYRSTPSTMIDKLRRIVVAATIVAMGRKKKMFNPAAIASYLDSILFGLKDLPFPLRGVVIVGPFSAPDPIVRFFRHRAVPIFEAAAKKHDCAFVDVFLFLESHPKGEAFRANFADAHHLSLLGHQRVGVLVGAALKRVMEQANVTESEPAMALPTKQVARAARPGWVSHPVVALRP
jgi:hypothetical protein